jgi:hypothetical protein
MHRLIAVASLLPVFAHAEVVFVDYVGTVNRIGNAPPGSEYRVGQPIKGRLLIDLVLAPPDLWPESTEHGNYSYLLEPGSPDWITGYSRRGAGPTLDSVFITSSPSDDWFSITDGSDPGGDAFRAISMTVGGAELFGSDLLDEGFHATRGNRLATFAGSLRWGWGEAAKNVDFFLKSFRVTPGRCKAPG